MGANADVRPVLRTRLPVKKIREIPNRAKFAGCIEVLNKPRRHEDHKESNL